MPFEHSGAAWRVLVPKSLGEYTRIYVYDHAHGYDQAKSLLAAQDVRDELALDMPFPLTAMLLMRTDGTYETQVRWEPNRKGGPVWSATYLRLDEATLKPVKATVSRSVATYGMEGARRRVERDWEMRIWEGALKIDALVRSGIPVHQHF